MSVTRESSGPGKQDVRTTICFPPGLLSVCRHLETSLGCTCPWDCLNHGRDENKPWPPPGPRRTYKKMHGYLCLFPCSLSSSGLPHFDSGTLKYRLQVRPTQWWCFFFVSQHQGGKGQLYRSLGSMCSERSKPSLAFLLSVGLWREVSVYIREELDFLWEKSGGVMAEWEGECYLTGSSLLHVLYLVCGMFVCNLCIGRCTPEAICIGKTITGWTHSVFHMLHCEYAQNNTYCFYIGCFLITLSVSKYWSSRTKSL